MPRKSRMLYTKNIGAHISMALGGQGLPEDMLGVKAISGLPDFVSSLQSILAIIISYLPLVIQITLTTRVQDNVMIY